jgi:carbon storage regulator
MLVLSRRLGESIVIGGEIYVTVVSVKGGQVRLGVTAPGDVPVDRLEVHERRLSLGAEVECHEDLVAPAFCSR